VTLNIILSAVLGKRFTSWSREQLPLFSRPILVSSCWWCPHRSKKTVK